MKPEAWSENTEQITREVLEEFLLGDCLWSKLSLRRKYGNIRAFGYMGNDSRGTAKKDSNLEVIDKETKEMTTFATIDALIADGWAAD